jgi:glycosyltransferase involved in cell wall biosynthesis
MSGGTRTARVRLAYLVSHPIQYQAPLLRRIAAEPDIDLTVLFGSDFSVRSYRDAGFGVNVAWDVPLTEGYKHEFLPALRDTRGVSATSPISRGVLRRLSDRGGQPAFDALWVHGYASVNALQAMLAAKALGIPVLLRAESWLGDRERSPWKLAAKRCFFAALKPLVAAVLPIGTMNSRYWTHSFSEEMPQFLMPYAVDNGFFHRSALAATADKSAFRESLGLAPGRPVILFASKLQQRKHCDHLLDAFAQIRSASSVSPAPYLVIVGDGEQRAALEAAVRDRAIPDVRFAGFQNQTELPRFFDLASVFVLPSRHEPWGLIVNEAMASGRAVIASTDCGCAADLIDDGVNGFTFAAGDVAALTECLRRTFATPDTPQRLGDAAFERMRQWNFEEDIRGLRAALAHVTRKLDLRV